MAGEGDNEPGVYSIGAVSRLLGTPAATIRNWEVRYGKIVPQRSPGGHRLYSPDQLEQLRFVAAAVARGLSAADAHRLLSEQSQNVQSPASEGSTDRERGLVLLAERDRWAAEPEQFALHSEGYAVTLALTADEAEDLWRESQPQLVIVELMISGGQGAELCRRLKQQGAGALLAISILEARDEALAAGADDFFQKPFDPLALVSSAKDILGPNALAGLAAEGTR
jgi:DNA-binding transcriptional MerR regulator